MLHWTTLHEGIGSRVHSHFAVEAAALFDPRMPDEGIEEVARHGRPDTILLSNRHHLRHAERSPRRSGARSAPRGRAARVRRRARRAAVRLGDEVAPGMRALEMGALTPEDTVFRLAAGQGALLFADAMIRGRDGALAYVPDALMGDDPEGVQRGLRGARRLVDADFDALLFAHGGRWRRAARSAARVRGVGEGSAPTAGWRWARVRSASQRRCVAGPGVAAERPSAPPNSSPLPRRPRTQVNNPRDGVDATDTPTTTPASYARSSAPSGGSVPGM